MIVALISGALAILATWLVLFLAFAGVGLAIKRAVNPDPINIDQLITSFWMGFSIAILFLQLWHLAFPVAWPSLAVILAIGAVSLFWNRALLRGWVANRDVRKNALLILALFVCALWTANGATAAGDEWDYGVYHLPAVLWTKSYPIVHGLGNLHGRLAFNSSYYLYVAMLDVGAWSGKSNHLANGLLAAVFLCQVVVAILGVLNSGERRQDRYAMELGLVAPALFFVLRRSVLASVMPDLPVAIILFVAATKLFKTLTGPRQEADQEAYDLIVVITLLTVSTVHQIIGDRIRHPCGASDHHGLAAEKQRTPAVHRSDLRRCLRHLISSGRLMVGARCDPQRISGLSQPSPRRASPVESACRTSAG